jgi:hypothetical protein
MCLFKFQIPGIIHHQFPELAGNRGNVAFNDIPDGRDALVIVP